MGTSVKIRMKVDEVVNGGVRFAGDEFTVPVETGEALVNMGKAEYVPTASPPPVHPEPKK